MIKKELQLPWRILISVNLWTNASTPMNCDQSRLDHPDHCTVSAVVVDGMKDDFLVMMVIVCLVRWVYLGVPVLYYTKVKRIGLACLHIYIKLPADQTKNFCKFCLEIYI